MLLSPYFQEFVANEGSGELPLEGTIPDMTSLTESVSCWCHPDFLSCDSNSPVITISLPESWMFLIHNICRYYVSLQKIYQAKAESDFVAMEHRVKDILKRIGRNPDSISRAYIKTFCKNARKLRVSCFLGGNCKTSPLL
jgi:NEDD8-activating enzyme E1 regulatory subunit